MKRLYTIVLLALAAVACIQDPEAPNNLPVAPALSVDESSVTRVSMVANVTFGNMADVTDYGVEVSETLFEAGGTYKTIVPQQASGNDYSAGVSDLTSNTMYFLRAYIGNGHSRMYSDILTQKTPETSVASVSDVTIKDNYYLVATIEDNGGRSIEDVGFIWGTANERKSIKREKRYPGTLSEDGKTFTLSLSDVGEGTHYIMAYAEDDKDGTGYSRIPYEFVLNIEDEAQIEDPEFKKYLVENHDYNQNGKISYAELKQIEFIDVHTDNIRSVREIEQMPLHSLLVSGKQEGSGKLTSLIVKKDTLLMTVDCRNNQLKELDASMIPNLEYLNCEGNPMEVLYLSWYQKFNELRYPEGCQIIYVDKPDEPEPQGQPNNEIWYTTADGSVVEINNPGSFNTTVVSNTYKDGKGIILFHDALTSIGDAAFWGAGFSSVELPNSLTTIGEQAFGANSLLETIHIPENVSSISWYRVFSQCKKLSSFTGKFATADHRALIVDGTMVGFAPAGLTEYTVDSGVKILGAVFESCFDLIRIVLPTGLEEVKGEAFEGCLGLTRIDLPSTLTSIGSFAFRDCSGLTTMDIPQSVVSIGDSVFDSCYGLGSFTGKFASEDGHYLVKGSSIIGFALAGVKEFIVPDGITATCPIDGFNNLLAISFPESIASLGQVTRCGSLASIVVNAITPPSTKLTHWWRNDPSLFYGTNSCPIYVPAQSVEAYQSADIWSSYASRIQAIPEVISPSKYLTFTSEGTTRVSLTNNLGNAPVLYYSLDKLEWTQWDYSELSFTAETPLYICGDNPKGFSSGSSKISRFTTEGDSFSVSGDIMSLLDFNNDLSVIPSSYCFNGLFSQCAGLTTAPDLPATTLTRCCYNYLFSGCSSLRIAPTLPATTLDVGCYEGMFQGCSSLTSAPALPATTMAQSCYHFMFYGCSSLTDAPELPATNLDSSCYLVMFFGCTSLTKAPELPATSLAPKCYSNMFSGCTGLTVAPQLPATTLATECYSGMFSDCSGLTEAPELPVTTLADRCYSAMFYGCSSLTTAPELPATTLTNGCYSEMFHYCENLTSAPILRAATLVDSCYESMFSRCFALNHIECLATDISATDALKEWLSAVSSTGTFVKSASMKDWPTGSSGIPNGWNVVNDGDVPNGGNEGTGEEEWN